MLNSERSLVGAHIIVAFAALFVGIFLGPFQAFHRSPSFVAAFPDSQIPVFSYYYQALTVHGAMNALWFTFIFISGVTYFITFKSLQRPLKTVPMAWAGLISQILGLAIIAVTVIADPQRSSVLFTFYPPLIAPPTFYLGAVLLVLGCWITAGVVIATYLGWRKDNPTKRLPLAVFAALANHAMFIASSIGVAVEVVGLLLPASLGILNTTNPQFSRALFWWFGHPLVYYWLIPAYISWYTMLPQQSGAGKVFSEPLAKVAFLLLMILALPTGVHHMYADPGVSGVWKAIHFLFTMSVALPSFMTAFNMAATLEIAGRKRGGKGLFGWMFAQKWGDPVVAAQLMGMILFVSGGISGIINASAQLNATVHNTSWIPGHFHQTVAGAVALTYFGIMYWMLPAVLKRGLFSKRMATWQVYTWGIGMIMFGYTMAEAGLLGVPRRTLTGLSPYIDSVARFWLDGAAISGVILLISSILLYLNIILTFFSKKPLEDGVVVDTEGDKSSPAILDNWKPWVILLIVLTAAAWLPPLIETWGAGFQVLRYAPTGPAPLP
jgi:cytochrome c oxidase subunit 1